MATNTAPFVRPYDPARDFDSAIHIFRETIHSAGRFEPAWTIGSYIWCRPYLQLPSACAFVLDDGSGVAVGYCIGTYDTPTFVKEWKDVYLPSLRDVDVVRQDTGKSAVNGQKDGAGDKDEKEKTVESWLEMLWGPEGMLMERWKGLVENYPAHLHIDILQSHQRQGHGRKLIEALLGALSQRGAKGVHLGMVATNENAYKFYHHLGFERFNEVMDDGESGEKGRTGAGDSATLWLVRKLG